MKRRFTVNSDGLLEDKHGVVLGRLTSITIEVPADALGVGTIGGVVASETTEATTTTDGGAGEGPSAAAGFVKAAGELLHVDLVWEHYVEVMAPRNKQLDAEGRKIILDALKVATVDECRRAIDGCAASDFHMGQNGRGRKYNRLSQILKARRSGPSGQAQTTRERIDFFLDMADKSGLPSGLTSVDPARLRQAKREVMDAWEYPGNEGAVARGEEAAAWLEQAGIAVGANLNERNRTGTPKPTFEVVQA